MKILSIVFSILLVVASLDAAAFSKNAKFRTTKIHLSSEKPLGTGSNTFILDIKVKGKMPTDASVRVKAFMPAMPGMPAMESKAQAKDLGNGKYEVTINLAMGGTWQLHIFITPKTGKKLRVKTSINI